MFRSDNQRREYLIRSQFHDVSLLSPVREEEESIDSPPRRARTHPALLPPARPCSPLPPLIIEVEKRVNKHDHPEDFYVRLERKMKRIYRRLFIEGRNISSPMSTDDEDVENSNDDNRSEERSNGNIDIDEGTDDGDSIETVVISHRSLKRRSNNDSRESDEEEVKAKKPNRNHSSRADDKPSSSSKEDFEDETIASSMAEEDFSETEENIETYNANVDKDSFEEEDGIDENYMEGDDNETTSESPDHIQVTFQADVHRAYSDESIEANGDLLPPANVAVDMADEKNDTSGDDSANESVEDPEAADEDIEQSLENNEVSENNSSSAPDRGLDMTTPCIQPDDVYDAEQPEQAGEGIDEPLEKDEVPYNSTLAPAPDRDVELMRTPVFRPSVGSLPEHMDSNVGEQIDFEFLNRTRDESVDDAIEDTDAETQNRVEDGPEGWGNIFYGQPRVFRLCHCRHHECE